MQPVALPITSIGLGELSFVHRAGGLLVARGLGSCIGIAVYEPDARFAVLAHVMLPGPAPAQVPSEQPARFADQAIASLIDAVIMHGGRARNCLIKLAGGAQVIRLGNKEDQLQVGRRNIDAVLQALAANGLSAAAQDVGGTMGRTLTLYAATGVTTVRLVGGSEQPL